MRQPYSQSTALWAIVRASFKAIFAHPSAIVFSILFPIIFVMIFGAFGSDRAPIYRVAVSPGCDTNNTFFRNFRNNFQVRVVDYTDTIQRNKDLQKGRLSGLLCVKETKDSAGVARYLIEVKTTSASNNTIGALMGILHSEGLQYELAVSGSTMDHVLIPHPQVEEVRPYHQIDFVLPGQLGFSILFSTLFGVAFTFFGLREQLVLKRFYATPVRKVNILAGIGVSRLSFQLLSVIVLILVGHFGFNFTLHHGIVTFFEIIFMTIIMLFLLMGVGLIFSSIVKADTSIPLLINLFGFPQMMLSGTFFPIEVFPKWLQEICKVLPLTQYNDAIRKISFEGQHITDCGRQLGILGLWMIIIYFILVRVLKWE
jgi:ABC-2 type transport system permease protein